MCGLKLVWIMSQSSGVSDEKLIEPLTLNTFIGNASRIWNKAPSSIKPSNSISIAEKEIKKFCETLPI